MSRKYPNPHLKSSIYIANTLRDIYAEKYELQSGKLLSDRYYSWERWGRYNHLSILNPSTIKSIFDVLDISAYIDHTIDKSSFPSDILWNKSSLKDAVLELEQNKSEAILTGKEKLEKQLLTKFAEQQFLAANLLKEMRAPHVYRLMGKGVSHGKASPEDAYVAAVQDFKPNPQETFMDWETKITGGGAYWSCTIVRPIIIEPAYVRSERTPDVLKNLTSKLYPSPRGTNKFDAHGTGIIYAPNKYSPPMPLPYYSTEPAMPDAFADGIYGPIDLYFVMDGHCGVDITPLFTYYDDSY